MTADIPFLFLIVFSSVFALFVVCSIFYFLFPIEFSFILSIFLSSSVHTQGFVRRDDSRHPFVPNLEAHHTPHLVAGVASIRPNKSNTCLANTNTNTIQNANTNTICKRKMKYAQDQANVNPLLCIFSFCP